MSFGTVAILGPGLIGGSLALALAERGLTDKLVIWGRNNKSFSAIREKLPQAILTLDIIEAVRDADIVVLCVPIETMKDLVEKFANSLKPTALVTDVGSVKESVDCEIAPLLAGKALWIGSHPMAGSEKSGFSAARNDLFVGAAIVITPNYNTPVAIIERTSQFWISVGGRVSEFEPLYHDLVVAEISHLPHLVAAILAYKTTDEARKLAGIELNYTPDQALKIAGGGFRDTTRIASGSPELWTEILMANRTAIARHLRALAIVFTNVSGCLDTNDATGLHEILKAARDARAKLPEINSSFKK